MDHFSSTRPQATRLRFFHSASATARPRVATSACLNGERVRYDGDSRYLPAIRWLTDAVELLPICPEVGAGMSVPRPPVQLVRAATSAAPRALGRDDKQLDATQALTAFADIAVARLAESRVCGYLLKSRSPSCGLHSTPLFDAAGMQIGTTSGIQAAHCESRLPWLAYCEETDLVDRSSAEAFALRCRLVFDWLHAGSAPLATLYRHYRFLIDRCDAHAQERLVQHLAADDRHASLCELQRHCEQLPPVQLLALFAE